MKINFDPKSSRVMQAEERLKAADHLQELGYPPVVDHSHEVINTGEDRFDMKNSLRQQLHDIGLNLQHENDYTPRLNTWYGVVVHAEAFGCEVVWPKEGQNSLPFQDPWVKPIIKYPEDVYKIKKPNPLKCVLTRRVLDTISYYQKEVGTEIPIAHTDTLSPFNIANLMWKSGGLLIACQTNPKEVHYLLKMITEFIIEFTRIQFDLIKNPCRQIWPYRGETREPLLTEDMAALVSPKFLQEFSLPYLIEISNAFGGLYIHSCGHNVHNLDTFLQIPNFRGIHIRCSPAEADPKAVMEKLYGRCAVCVVASEFHVGWKDGLFHDIKEVYHDYILPGILTYGGKGIILIGLSHEVGYGSEYSKELKNENYNWVVNEAKNFLIRHHI